MSKPADRLLTVAAGRRAAWHGVRSPGGSIAERRIRFVRVGRHVRIPESALAEFIAAGTVEPVTPGRIGAGGSPDARRKRRSFGTIRRLPSGRWQARYRGPDGIAAAGTPTFTRKADADRWLALTEAEMLGATGSTPTRAASLSLTTPPPGSPSGQACGPRPSSSTATCCAATWPAFASPNRRRHHRGRRAPLARRTARLRGHAGHRRQGVPAAQIDHGYRR